ncbi:hypothetical protein Cgig2_002051 [Carnegiea gigantea]|uniref:DNA-directed RNA polymerase n=1 Tax=Carnegiea gigantea TaxID=171969 RepID=A0A9Q1JX31_9CARY|nr:hypothetical protein Cgig2_002051 [Carnegiea gigantea]
MRRALLGEIEGTCITRAKSEKIPHEYSTIVGIQESVHEILMNLKEIALGSNLYETYEVSICVRGPRCVTVQDIILPPYVEIVDNTQHIAGVTEPIDLYIGLQLERNHGYCIKAANNFQDGSYPINALFIPIRNEVELRKKPFIKLPGVELIYLFLFYMRKKKTYSYRTINTKLTELSKKKIKKALKYILIDQLELLPRIYNCLKKSNIHI